MTQLGLWPASAYSLFAIGCIGGCDGGTTYRSTVTVRVSAFLWYGPQPYEPVELSQVAGDAIHSDKIRTSRFGVNQKVERKVEVTGAYTIVIVPASRTPPTTRPTVAHHSGN